MAGIGAASDTSHRSPIPPERTFTFTFAVSSSQKIKEQIWITFTAIIRSDIALEAIGATTLAYS